MKSSFGRAILQNQSWWKKSIPLIRMISIISSARQTLMIAFTRCMIRLRIQKIFWLLPGQRRCRLKQKSWPETIFTRYWFISISCMQWWTNRKNGRLWNRWFLKFRYIRNGRKTDSGWNPLSSGFRLLKKIWALVWTMMHILRAWFCWLRYRSKSVKKAWNKRLFGILKFENKTIKNGWKIP